MKFFKKIYEINNLYWNERRIIWHFITPIFVFTFQGIAFFINDLVKINFLNFLLFILFMTIISIVPIILIFMKIENCLQGDKNTNLKIFLEKVMKIEFWLKSNLTIRISALVLTFAILIFTLIQKSMLNSLFITYLLIVTLALYIQVQYFIDDFLLINKKSLKNKEIK